MNMYAWLFTPHSYQNGGNLLLHIFFTCSPTVHKTFISDCCIFYETMCIELTGECSLKDKWLELE